MTVLGIRIILWQSFFGKWRFCGHEMTIWNVRVILWQRIPVQGLKLRVGIVVGKDGAVVVAAVSHCGGTYLAQPHTVTPAGAV